MKFLQNLGWAAVSQLPSFTSGSDELTGVYDLATRQVPKIASQFEFHLDKDNSSTSSMDMDKYTVVQDPDTKRVNIEGNSKTAILAGLYQFLNQVGHASISFTHSTLSDLVEMPDLCAKNGNCTMKGEAVVRERYEFNTCTFGYTMPFFDFDKDWSQMLDYSALSASATMMLAWTGYEQVMIETLKEFGFTNEHLANFFVSQPYLPWGRFGNIQGNFNATFDFDIPKKQLKLQKKILKRMADLGIKPILPAFVGFLPREVSQVHPNASVTNSTQWNNFPYEYTNTTFLDPLDPLFGQIQSRFLENQAKHYGKDITNYYTLDQFNEVTPASSTKEYLNGVMSSAVNSLKEHNKDAVLVMQAWNFYYDDYWTSENVKNYLGGAEQGDLLILDLYSDHVPLYPDNDGYHGHDFIYSSLHDFGSAMGFEGSIQFLTQNLTRDRAEFPGLSGVGITPEGLEGNQMMYDVLFAQAWSEEALDISSYVEQFIRARYGPQEIPGELVQVWQDITQLVYTNDQKSGVYSVPRGIHEVRPALEEIADKPGIQPNKLHYDPTSFEPLWRKFAEIVVANPHLVRQPHVHNDIVDVTRQYLANKFLGQYRQLVSHFKGSSASNSVIRNIGDTMLQTLDDLDDVLFTNYDFTLAKWIKTARAMGSSRKSKDQLEFQARNIVTGWGPQFQNNDYSARSWAGLVGTYHKPRWEKFISYLQSQERVDKPWLKQWTMKTKDELNKIDSEFIGLIEPFEEQWQWQKYDQSWNAKGDILEILKRLL